MLGAAKVKLDSPTILVLLGATGDLVGRKILPALYQLHQQSQLPNLFRVVGFSRRDWADEDFRSYLSDLMPQEPTSLSDSFLNLFSFSGGNFDDPPSFQALNRHLTAIDKDLGLCANKLFYLAVPPRYYKTIFNNLGRSGLTSPCGSEEGWTRVIVEKPFGENLKTAQELDNLLSKLFREEQIYRIDHYLAKEMSQNILAFRFANNLLEDSWNRQGIEEIRIKLWEEDSVQDRGHFYDGVGALRDVGQNHALQMLALVTMDQPESFTDTAIRIKRAKALNQLSPFTLEEVSRQSYRAQHQGYRNIQGVAGNSMTETYFRIKAKLDGERWGGTPITIEGGKRLPRTEKFAQLIFAHPSPCLCPQGEHFRNKTKFSLSPNKKIEVNFWAKKPGLKYDLEEQKLSFQVDEDNKQTQYTDEYSKLLLDCIAGDQTLFVSTNELKAMWTFIDPILKGWEQNLVPLETYPQGGEPG